MPTLSDLTNIINTKPEVRRSSKWPKVRLEHLKIQPFCQACGTKLHLEVHHIQPFHLFPERELDLDNLWTLCETPSSNCHFFLGHGRNWKLYIPNIKEICMTLLPMFQHINAISLGIKPMTQISL